MAEASLVSICDFLKRQSFFEFEPVAESLSWLGQIYSRGWLYTSSRGDEILAVAAAFRIPEWSDEYLKRLPSREEGNKLYIAFFSSVSNDASAALKLLREHLRNNPGITEIIYHRKKGWSGPGPLRRFSRERVMPRIFREEENGFSRRKLIIAPPSLVPAAEVYPVYLPHSIEERQIRLVSGRLLESAGRACAWRP